MYVIFYYTYSTTLNYKDNTIILDYLIVVNFFPCGNTLMT